MKVTRKNLDDAVSEQIISADQADRLHDYLKSLDPHLVFRVLTVGVPLFHPNHKGGGDRGGIVCLGTLALRRRFLGAELGARLRKPTAALFVSLWLLYILLSALDAYGYLGKNAAE